MEQWLWEKARNKRAPKRQEMGIGKPGDFSHLNSPSGTRTIPSVPVPSALTPKKFCSIGQSPANLGMGSKRKALSSVPAGGSRTWSTPVPKAAQAGREETPRRNRGAAGHEDEFWAGNSENVHSGADGNEPEVGESVEKEGPVLLCPLLPGALSLWDHRKSHHPRGTVVHPGYRKLEDMEVRQGASSLQEAAGRSKGTPRHQDGVNKPTPGKQGCEKKSSNYKLERDLFVAPGRVPGAQRHR